MSKFWVSDAWRDASSKLSRGQLKCDGTRVFRRNGRVHLNRRGRQLSRLLATASAVVMLDTPCSEVVRRVLATHAIRQFPLHFPSLASPCTITFQLQSTHKYYGPVYKILSPSLPGAWDLCAPPLPPAAVVAGISVSGASSRTMKNRMKSEREKLGWEASVTRGRHTSSTGLCHRSTKHCCCTCEYASRERRKWRFSNTSLSCWC